MNMKIPYGRQSISESDIEAVVEVLRSDFLTQGPKVQAFSHALAQKFQSKYASVTNNATLALYTAYRALGLGPKGRLWTAPNTFVATSNAAILCGAQVDFVDIHPETFCMSVGHLKEKLVLAEKENTLPDIVVPVHFAGQPCDMEEIYNLSKEYGFKVVEDAAHAVGAFYKGKPVGACEFSDICVFSFHPVKIITTGEGGALLTQSQSLKQKIDQLITHGITKDQEEFESEQAPPWYYEQQDISLNSRLTDMQSALGLSQLQSLDKNIERRQEIALKYKQELSDLPLKFQMSSDEIKSSWHLFVICLKDPSLRLKLFNFLREQGILVNVHYIPVFTQPYYKKLGFDQSMCPKSSAYYESCLSLPMYHSLADSDQVYVIGKLKEFFNGSK